MTAALRELPAAIAGARALGIDVGSADDLLRETTERLGLTGDAWVLALVGGTGVGKSTLLNALAGAPVSPAAVRRPTTTAAIAWVGEGTTAGADDLGPLLARLDARRVDAKPGAGLRGVVVLDLPDLDSIELGHRRRVEELLPRVDAVAWVTDPEKYADGLLHDELLRHWLPRLAHQAIVLNKVDRLRPAAVASVARDLAGRITADAGAARAAPRRSLAAPPPQMPLPRVIATSANGGPGGIAELRRWLEDGIAAKEIVQGRLEAAAGTELYNLAVAAGVDQGHRTLLPPQERVRVADRAAMAALAVLDERGTAARAAATVRDAARRRGTGPVGWLTAGVASWLRPGGTEASKPSAYLAAWRERGRLNAAAEEVRSGLLNVLPDLPPDLRPTYALALGEVEHRLAEAADRAVRAVADERVPTSRWWPFLGLLQGLNHVVLVLVAAWLVAWFVVRPAVPDVVLPVVGAVPAPLAIAAAALLAGYVLARALGLHAGWLGRRWAGRLESRLRTALREAVAEVAFEPVDRLETARREVWEALRRAGARGVGAGPGPG